MNLSIFVNAPKVILKHEQKNYQIYVENLTEIPSGWNNTDTEIQEIIEMDVDMDLEVDVDIENSNS